MRNVFYIISYVFYRDFHISFGAGLSYTVLLKAKHCIYFSSQTEIENLCFDVCLFVRVLSPLFQLY